MCRTLVAVIACGALASLAIGFAHADWSDSKRNRIRREHPDILLTTPESLEAMLIGTKTDHRELLGHIRSWSMRYTPSPVTTVNGIYWPS